MARVTESPSMEAGRARRPRRTADPSRPPFSGFLDRDALREQRGKGRNRTVLISIGIHIAVFLSLFLYSLWQVDELFSPSVRVTVFAPGKAPAQAAPQPAPLVLPAPQQIPAAAPELRPAPGAAGQTR